MYKRQDVHYAFDMEKTSIESIPEELKFRAINGYNRERSGGVQTVSYTHLDVYKRQVPITEPPSTSRRAATFTTNWKKRKRCRLR